MDPKKQKQESIITEDGQRLAIVNGEIAGTEDSGDGLAYQTNNNSDEESKDSNELTNDDKQAGKND